MKLMRSIYVATFIAGCAAPATAQELAAARTAERATRTAIKFAVEPVRSWQAQPTIGVSIRHQPSQRSWVRRHPVAAGALIGFGVGATIGATTCRYPGV